MLECEKGGYPECLSFTSEWWFQLHGYSTLLARKCISSTQPSAVVPVICASPPCRPS